MNLEAPAVSFKKYVNNITVLDVQQNAFGVNKCF